MPWPKGRPQSEESNAKRRNFHHSEATIEVIRQASLGHHPSEETKAKMRATQLGRHPTEETKQKIRLAVRQRGKGRNNPNWKGGRRLTTSGYIIIYQAPHDYILEHVLIWEQVHGKKIPEGWIIHHLNGVKTDNHPRNLLAMPRKGHHDELVNQALKQRIRELEAEVKLLERTLDNQQMIVRIEEN